ncbi:hypothetical protein [Corynebacterium kutscheri]|uniref:Surface-anchored protein n=1 Tax=Corynebacterium kutscheri TaxID=35755 RepID=A0AB38VTB8_9CORY|nr:hypothetical protein [Corynebacterium kutscheri]VEH06472.1 surface-anchored protein [Corynebacterium kutscheri]
MKAGKQQKKLQEWQFYSGGEHADKLVDQQIATTGQDGVAVFENPPLGLYYVTENYASAQRQNLSLVAPFLVTLPTTNATRDGWDYDITVAAKDQLIAATKQANRTCVTVGDTVTYGISGSLPAPDKDGVITRYSIADPLAANHVLVPDSSQAFFSDTHKQNSTQELVADDFEVTVAADNVARLNLTNLDWLN